MYLEPAKKPFLITKKSKMFVKNVVKIPRSFFSSFMSWRKYLKIKQEKEKKHKFQLNFKLTLPLNAASLLLRAHLVNSVTLSESILHIGMCAMQYILHGSKFVGGFIDFLRNFVRR